MLELSKDKIREIASELECGMVCYCKIENQELVSIVDFDHHIYAEEEDWAEQIEKIEKEREKYLMIEPMDSHESFRVMDDFIETVDNDKLAHELKIALEKKQPFQNFKYVINNSGEYREKWFKFREQKYNEWVEQQLEMYNN
ncbi:MAG: hypothetical protein A2X61_10820 [Ignavibacteria bacterium GWB2_35_12]|nr:MAG: hypothetical protein A2X63_11000 [Ignavibacteria bacterium GWA2_35_8]OGU40303.1 MAG: hypothetical protein A2X61_10820 [Ignavibacteria bacterium GWB2_35_12]OGU93039.1 MAG: hypothetical protein A2220_15940 [Ignavibacteria bacterium RIFOXYA2_FULL_35_10]OGV24731.1 MAG: hypothetical protein A2475_14045 [Ignavibacteria bacterium RIFOXYC2_FULL_35_21]